jgi:hypothetical protein
MAIDARALNKTAQTVNGFVLSQLTNLRDCLLPLQQAYHFDIVESDFKLQFIPRGSVKPITINLDDLGAQEVGQTQSDTLIETHCQTAELPQRVNILFADGKNDYQQGHQLAERSGLATSQ